MLLRIDIAEEQRLTIPHVNESNVEQIAEELDQLLQREGPLDLVVLGLGRNGHIAFNEPTTSPFVDGYHVVELCPTTLQSNFPKSPPDSCRALTISVPQICSARSVCLVVPQQEKQEILQRSLASAPTPELPASPLAQHKALDVFHTG